MIFRTIEKLLRIVAKSLFWLFDFYLNLIFVENSLGHWITESRAVLKIKSKEVRRSALLFLKWTIIIGRLGKSKYFATFGETSPHLLYQIGLTSNLFFIFGDFPCDTSNVEKFRNIAERQASKFGILIL